MDFATLEFRVESGPAERGATATSRALDVMERAINRIMSLEKQFNESLRRAFSFGGGGAATQAVARQQTVIESGLQRHQQRVTQIQTLAEANAQRHQQRLLQIESVKAAQLASVFARRESAEQRHAQRLAEIQQREAARASRVDTGAAGIAGVGAALSVAGLVQSGREAVQAAVKFDSITRALTAVSGSSAEAAKQLERLREIGRLPGISFEEAVEGSVRLQAVGFSAGEAERSLKAFANAIALTGGGAAQLQSVTVQLAQLSSKGKVLAQDLRPIIEAAPAVGKALKAAFGTVDSELISKQLEAAGKSSKDFIGILLTELEKIPKVTGGPKEALQDFATTTQVALAKVGDAILRVLAPALGTLGPLMERVADKFAALPQPVQTLLVLLSTLAATAGPVILAAGLLATKWAALQVVFTAGTAAIKATALSIAAINPIVLGIVAVLAIATAAWIAYESSVDKAAKVTLESVQAQTATIRQSQVQGAEVAALAQKQSLNTAEHQRLVDVIRTLDPATQAYINSLKGEKTQAEALTRAIQELNKELAFKSRADAIVTADALVQKERELTQALSARAALTREAAEVDKLLASGQTTLTRIVADSGAQTVILTDEVKRLGFALGESNTQIDAVTKTLIELGAKYKAQAENAGLANKSVTEQALALGRTREEMNLIQVAIERYNASQNKAKDATEATNQALRQQALDLRGLADAANVANTKKVFDDILKSASTAAIEAGEGAAGAVRRVKEAMAFLPDLQKGLNNLKLDESNQAALRKAFFPSAGGGAAKAATEAARAQEALLQATLARQRVIAEGALANFQGFNKGLLALLENDFDRGLLTAENYFSERERLQTQAIDQEIAALRQREVADEAAATKSLALIKNSTAREAERIKVVAELLGIQNQIADKEREREAIVLRGIIDESKRLQILKEQLAAEGAIIGLANAPKIQEKPPVPETLQKLADTAPKARNVDAIEAALRLREVEIQNEVILGLKTEREARQAILAVQREYRDELLERLRVELAIAEIPGAAEDEAERIRQIAQLKILIEEYKTLGAERSKLSQIFGGLRDDSRDLINNLQQVGQSIRDTFVNAFQRAFREGPKAFFQSILQGFSDLLSKMAAEILTSQLVKLLGGIFKLPTQGGVFGPGGTVPFNPNAGTGVGGGGGIKDTIASALGLKKTATDTVLPQIATSVSLIDKAMLETVALLRQIAGNTADSASCCRQAEQNAASKQLPTGGALSTLAGILGIAGGVFGAIGGFGGDKGPKATGFQGGAGFGDSFIHRASGGDFVAGQRFWKDEGGAELVAFNRPGHVYNARETKEILQGEGKGGDQNISVTFNITATDVESFRRSKDQVMAEFAAELSRTVRNQ